MDGLYSEIWQEPDGCTSLLFSGQLGDQSRNLLADGSILLKTIFAKSHFEAMTIYWEFMGWGEYVCSNEMDMQPYSEWFKEK